MYNNKNVLLEENREIEIEPSIPKKNLQERTECNFYYKK